VAQRAFLRSRRDKIAPEQAGLPRYGQRRVPGLRRAEVATLAGVSVEYYTRLERGNLQGVSDSVLNALDQALRLDNTERMYLYDLARAAGPAPAARVRQRQVRPTVRPSVARIVEGMPAMPAFVMNNRLDALAANPLGRAVHPQRCLPRDVGIPRRALCRAPSFSSRCRRHHWSRSVAVSSGSVVPSGIRLASNRPERSHGRLSASSHCSIAAE
jgi:transcriptional regulator with XRE-family HTH domain